MAGSSFDLIAQEILKQQRLMEELGAENRELRRQLIQLRTGHGIVVQIGDKRIALDTLLSDKSQNIPHVPSDAAAASAVTTPETPEAPLTSEAPIAPEVADPPAVAISSLSSTSQIAPAATPEPAPTASARQESKPQDPPTFLEEIMLDEFAAAATSPMAVWKGPSKKSEVIDEEKKAALRRELTGSFLLE